ncbi:MAG: hypothetical protein ACFFBJ_03005 [Promethearchaeota archaeon]
MYNLLGVLLVVVFIGGILLILILDPRTGFVATSMKMRRAISSPWSLAEFIRLESSKRKNYQYYSFSEENVRSLGHRYVGRLDAAILHWEQTPILDLVIEYKFPVNHLPNKAREEDVFQSGLYALALQESGVSCSSARIVTIYCFQDKAKECVSQKTARQCWRCNDGKTFTTRFRPGRVQKDLSKLDEVWYKGRRARPVQKPSICRACPYSKNRCNYSAI